MMISGLQSSVPGNMARKCNLLLPVSKGDGKVEEVRFTESNSSFPICNHTQCVDKNNGSITKLMGFRIPHIINTAQIKEF